MKRSDFAIRLISIVVFLALAVYIGYSVIETQLDPLKTTLAIGFTVEDSVSTQGYAVRQEQLLGGSNAVVTAQEGEHLSAAEPYAVEYKSSQALARAQQIRELELQIAQINAQLSGESSAAAAEVVLDLARISAAGNTQELDSVLLDVQAYLFGSTEYASADELEARRAALQQQRDALVAQSEADTNQLLTGRAGTFSAVTDGLESVTPEQLKSLSPAAFDGLFSGGGSTGAVGKLVLGLDWYYTCVMDQTDATRLDVGKNATLRFTQNYGRTLTMKVVSIGPETDGRCVVTFSSNKFLSEVAALRELSAEVIFSSVSGLRVPKEAVHLDEDGGTYLYILTGLQAHQVSINILGELGEYYVAEGVTESLLTEGVRIIVKANGLYDGKVVQ